MHLSPMVALLGRALAIGCGGKVKSEGSNGEPDLGETPAATGEPTSNVDDAPDVTPPDMTPPSMFPDDPGGPSEPPPDEPPMVDVLGRCNDMCDLPEIVCQSIFGSAPDSCSTACDGLVSYIGTPACSGMLVEMLECLEDAAREAQCTNRFNETVTARCGELLSRLLDCPSSAPM